VKEGDSLLLQGRANDIRSRVRRYPISMDVEMAASAEVASLFDLTLNMAPHLFL
jgi:hypothetical protein